MFNFVSNVFTKVQEYRQYRKIVAQLSALEDKMLADIGVNRGEIPAIAKSSAKKKMSKKVVTGRENNMSIVNA